MMQFVPGDLVKARGREWVVLPERLPDTLTLRPLTGNENDTVILDPNLELTPVVSAQFDLPVDAKHTVQPKAALLADALQMTLRRGAGPFRSAGQLAFEPRTYQLVPLLMALKHSVPRLLIADGVGVGKTIEAGLILREFMDRGEVNAFTVLCPPHLIDQWTAELEEKFGIEAVAVTASSASRLERNRPPDQTLFRAYPHTVVSLDYIKADRRRDNFARTCPDFVVVDEAHTCVGTHRGKQQRFELLSSLAEDKERAMIMLTATPHSGDELAFGRLLSLIDPEFEALEAKEKISSENKKYREKLAQHYVQRGRKNLDEREWGESDKRLFPEHKETELKYELSYAQRDFQETVLKFYDSSVGLPSLEGRRKIGLNWSTLTLLRCMASSPAAGLSTLKKRLQNEKIEEFREDEFKHTKEQVESRIYDDEADESGAGDIEPGVSLHSQQNLNALLKKAEKLFRGDDLKLEKLISGLKTLLAKNANPVVFCRYLATADYVSSALKKKFPNVLIECVTGNLPPDERRERINGMVEEVEGDHGKQRILVATDCLSEGINLQKIFDAVIHYDLSWNPIRHQQREGRVDRYGQPSKDVHSMIMYSPASHIDRAVLEVIVRKATDIWRATGVTVPLPEERGPVTEALMSAIMRGRSDQAVASLNLMFDDDHKTLDLHWRDASEKEKRSRARFAQNAMKPEEVKPEWERARKLLGTPEDARRFVEHTMSNFGVPLEQRKGLILAHVHALEDGLRKRLEQAGLEKTIKLVLRDPAPVGTAILNRTHPLTVNLAESLLESSLDSETPLTLGVGRVGAWPSEAVSEKTTLALLRIRFKLHVSSRKRQLLLAEEAALVAIQNGKVTASGDEVREWLYAPAISNIAEVARTRFVSEIHSQKQNNLSGALRRFIRQREFELSEDHARVRRAAKASPEVRVEAVFPPDIIGMFVLLPGQSS